MAIYQTFESDDIVTANQTIVTTGLWSGDTGSLNSDSIFVSTQQIDGTGTYYVDIYNRNPDPSVDIDGLAEVQFAVAYGHANGGGAPTLAENQDAKLPTKATYSQYKQLLLDPTDALFTFANNATSEHIYVINLQRARVREQLDPGNWMLPLSGVNGIHTFIDDSNQTLGAFTANSKAGRVFNIISGSLAGPLGVVTASIDSTTFGGKGYGLVYPDLGIIVLNPDAIGPAVGFRRSIDPADGVGGAATGSVPLYTKNTVGSSTIPYAAVTHSVTWGSNLAAYNQAGLLTSLQLATDVSVSNFDFLARSAETISSTHYFVRLRNSQFNYSNNPTFSDPDTGELIISQFRQDPQVYVTSVGLYNDQNELLAVAKLSKPVRKSFDEELLLRVRLDF